MRGMYLFPVGKEEVKTRKVNTIAIDKPMRDRLGMSIGQIQLGDEEKSFYNDLAQHRHLLPPEPRNQII